MCRREPGTSSGGSCPRRARRRRSRHRSSASAAAGELATAPTGTSRSATRRDPSVATSTKLRPPLVPPEQSVGLAREVHRDARRVAGGRDRGLGEQRRTGRVEAGEPVVRRGHVLPADGELVADGRKPRADRGRASESAVRGPRRPRPRRSRSAPGSGRSRGVGSSQPPRSRRRAAPPRRARARTQLASCPAVSGTIGPGVEWSSTGTSTAPSSNPSGRRFSTRPGSRCRCRRRRKVRAGSVGGRDLRQGPNPVADAVDLEAADLARRGRAVAEHREAAVGLPPEQGQPAVGRRVVDRRVAGPSGAPAASKRRIQVAPHSSSSGVDLEVHPDDRPAGRRRRRRCRRMCRSPRRNRRGASGSLRARRSTPP